MTMVQAKVDAILAAVEGKERDRLVAVRWLCRSASAFLAAVKKFQASPDVIRHARRTQSKLQLAKKARTALITLRALAIAVERLAEILFLRTRGKAVGDAIAAATADLREVAKHLRLRLSGLQMNLFEGVA